MHWSTRPTQSQLGYLPYLVDPQGAVFRWCTLQFEYRRVATMDSGSYCAVFDFLSRKSMALDKDPKPHHRALLVSSLLPELLNRGLDWGKDHPFHDYSTRHVDFIAFVSLFRRCWSGPQIISGSPEAHDLVESIFSYYFPSPWGNLNALIL